MNLKEKFLSWFTPTKVKELEQKVLQLEQKLPVLQKGTDLVDEIEKIKVEKLISKILYNINTKNITIILYNGNVLSGIVEKDVYEKIRNCNDESLILELISPPKIEEKNGSDFDIDIERIITPLINILSTNDNFEIEVDKVYLKGIKTLAIPSSIVAEFIRIESEMNENSSQPYGLDTMNKGISLEEEFNSLLMFTHKLLLNPVERAREDCLEYVKNYDIKLTNTGNMIMYRRIVALKSSENRELVEFISQQYLKVKSWKKSPKNFTILEEGGTYSLGKIDSQDDGGKISLGNLAELYANLSSMEDNRYTDDYTRSYDIRIGETYKIREEDIDTNKNGSCGGSLHCSDGKVFSYSCFGDTPVVVIVNPMHVYKMDSGSRGKIGVKQMFIVGITTQDEEGNYEDIDSQALVNFDEMYHNETISELQEALKSNTYEVLDIKQEKVKLSPIELGNITEMLANRIVKV